jgi:hypothetical protein
MAGASRSVMCVMPDASAMAEATCPWCAKPFRPRRGGSRQRFCCPRHRVEFHTAARLWAERATVCGILTIGDLRNGPGEPCTLLPCRQSPVPLADIGSADPALLAALRTLGRVVLRVPIAPEGVAELVRLGWLERRQGRQPTVLADVLIELANAALDTGLRPR